MSDLPAKVDLVKLDDAGFERLYAERIKPCYDTYEPERLAGVDTFKRRMMIASAIAVAATVGVYLAFRSGGFAFMAAVLCAVFGYGWAYSKLAEVQRKVKIASCSAVAQSVGVSYTIEGFAPPAFDRQRALDLVPGFDRSKFEDLFHGAHDDAAFDLYEAHLERRHRDSKGRTHWSTVFRGQLVRLQFPRKFLGVTIVRRDAGLFNVFGGGGKLKLERVGLEDPIFEKVFEVFGTDQVEARYLLHPVLMQRLLDLETSLSGKRLRCAFEDGDLLIAIEGGDLFEPGDMFKPLADPARARQIVDDIAGVLRVMDQVLTAQAKRRATS